MRDNEFYESDEPTEDVEAAFDSGDKGVTRRPRLDSIHSVRFTPDQADRIRAAIGGDGSVSEFIRAAVFERLYPPQPVRTYACSHISMTGAFVEPPVCGQGCAMSEHPLTQTTWGAKTISCTFADPYAA